MIITTWKPYIIERSKRSYFYDRKILKFMRSLSRYMWLSITNEYYIPSGGRDRVILITAVYGEKWVWFFYLVTLQIFAFLKHLNLEPWNDDNPFQQLSWSWSNDFSEPVNKQFFTKDTIAFVDNIFVHNKAVWQWMP